MTRRRLLAGLLALLAAGYAGVVHWRTKNISTVQRGWMVAFRKGCFTCHGPGGIRGMPDPGHGLGDIPAFSGGLITMYARDEDEVREWILDGMPKRVRDDPEQMKLRANATIRMPAWRGMISAADLHDLVAFVKATSDIERPDDEKAEAGRSIAERTGCFNCHGPQGRGSMPNVRAFKGYIPSWDGADFPELASNDMEIRFWILDGGPNGSMRIPWLGGSSSASPSRCRPTVASSPRPRWSGSLTTFTGCDSDPIEPAIPW